VLNTRAAGLVQLRKPLGEIIKLTDQNVESIKKQIQITHDLQLNEEYQSIARLEQLLQEGSAIQRVLDRGIKGSEDLTGHLEAMKPKLSSLGEAAQSFGVHMGRAFEGAIVYGDSFSNVLRGLLADLENAILKTLVWKELFNATKGMTGVGGFFNSFFKGLAGFAAGGSVTGRDPIIVGEKGPEIFYPAVSGTIIPNNRLGANVTVNNYIDARGADVGVEQRIMRALQATEDRAVVRAVHTQRELALRSA